MNVFVKIIFLILCLFPLIAQANQVNFIIPFLTYHTNDEGLNNKNYGLGFEFKTEREAYSIAVLDNNSYNESSVYLSISKIKNINKNIYLSVGVTIANGYKASRGNDIESFPLFSVKVYNFKISTTYPASALFCNAERCHDFINVQYIAGF